MVNRRWNSSTSCKTAHIMCRTICKTRTKYVLALPRRDCRILVGILTGHCMIATHAFKLGITSEEHCRKCKETGALESLEHLLCSCPALSRNRHKHLGAFTFTSLMEVSNCSTSNLLNFAKVTRLCYDS